MKFSLSKFIVAALLISSVSAASPLIPRPASAQQQLVAMADQTAMVVLCFRMSPRTTDVDKQAVISYLTQQGLTGVGFRPNGYECIGQGTCADAMRIMKSQLYVAQLTLSNQMILAYRFDPLPQNPAALNNKARYANVSEAPGYGSGGSSSTTGGGGTSAGGYSNGSGYGSTQQGGAQQGGVQQGGYQYGSGQGELGNGQIGSPGGSQYVRTGSDFGNTGGGNTGGGFGNTGSGFGNTGGGFGNTGGGSGNTGSGSGNTGSGFGNTGSGYGNSGSGYGNTGQYNGGAPQMNQNIGSSGGGSTPIWNKTNGTLSRSGQGNPELYTTNYSNNGTLNNTGLFPNSGAGNTGSGNTGSGYGNTGYGNQGTGSQGGGGTQTNPNIGTGGGGGGTPIWNQSNGTLSRSGQGDPELYGNTAPNNATTFGNTQNTPAYNPNTPAYNPNLPNGNQLPPPIQGTAGPPN